MAYKPLTTILDFCANCGVLLPSDLGLEGSPECSNCGRPLKEREHRIQGHFGNIEAKRLMATIC